MLVNLSRLSSAVTIGLPVCSATAKTVVSQPTRKQCVRPGWSHLCTRAARDGLRLCTAAAGHRFSGSFARGRYRRGRSEIPIFAVNCCCLPLSFRRSREKRRKRGKCVKKGEKCVEKGEKCVEKGENRSDPIYTNPIKNLPSFCRAGIEILYSELSVRLGLKTAITIHVWRPLG